MTVPVQIPVSNHVGNGVTTTFAYTFKLLDQADLLVTVGLVTKTIGVDYTVTGVGVEAGGTVVFTAAPASLVEIALVRQVAINRLTDYQIAGDFEAPTVNRDFDRIVMMVQDSGIAVANAVRFPPGDPADGVLPSVANRALKALAFDAAGNPVAVAGAGDATALAAALVSTTPTTGGALVGFDSANTYPANTVGLALKTAATFATDAASVIDAAKGSALLGYKPTFTGAVGRTLSNRLQDHVNAADFGLLPTNTGAQNVTAWGLIMAFTAVTPCTVQINRGTYDFNASISFNSPNTRITGEGIDATILRCTFATGDFITQTGTKFYQTIDNLTLTSSVTRTSGAMFKSGFWKRGLMYRVKIEKHFNGINLPEFEQCTIAESNIVSPTGAGTSLIAGTPSATNTGANLNILNCLLRGNDETIPGSAAVGLRGYDIYDVQAIFSINTDLSTYTSHACMIAPQTQAANFYFLETYFDATVSGHNVYMAGTGEKISIQFTSCWFAGAGASGAGSANQNGLALDNVGTYRDILVSAGRFITTSAAGIYVGTPYMALNVTGSNFVNCGFNAGSTNRDSIFVGPAAGASKTLNVTGNLFDGANGFDVKLGSSNATGRVNLSGNAFNAGLGWPDGTLWGNVGGNTDASVSPIGVSVASASTIQVPPVYNYVTISGTTNINRIQPTYPGHQLSMRFLAALTVVDDGNNIRLVGNYVTTGNSVLTLVCEANGDWREVARATS